MEPKKIVYVLLAVFSLQTSCQKNIDQPTTIPAKVTLVNNGYENGLEGWKVETDYKGIYGFSSDTGARRTGNYGLNFYAAQPTHFPGAPQETPWNGKIYQTVSGLKDGAYTLKAYADAVGDGMYLWAEGDAEQPAAKSKINSDVNELNTLDFMVKGGTAKIGFICINAGGTARYAPYFHGDDIELWSK